MPEKDWQDLYEIICEEIELRYRVECVITDIFNYKTIQGVGLSSMNFPPVLLQFDNVVYEMPFERWFDLYDDDTLVMREWTVGDKFIIGMNFLNTYYSAYDMQRNQMALVPNIHNSDSVKAPFVLTREPFYIIMPCLTVLFLCVLAIAALNTQVNGSSNLLATSTLSDKAQSSSSATNSQSGKQRSALKMKSLQINEEK